MRLEAIREDRTRGGRSTYQCNYGSTPATPSTSASAISPSQSSSVNSITPSSSSVQSITPPPSSMQLTNPVANCDSLSLRTNESLTIHNQHDPTQGSHLLHHPSSSQLTDESADSDSNSIDFENGDGSDGPQAMDTTAASSTTTTAELSNSVRVIQHANSHNYQSVQDNGLHSNQNGSNGASNHIHRNPQQFNYRLPRLIAEIAAVEHLWQFNTKQQTDADREKKVIKDEGVISSSDDGRMTDVSAPGCSVSEPEDGNNLCDHGLYKLVKWCKSLPLFRDIQVAQSFLNHDPSWDLSWDNP